MLAKTVSSTTLLALILLAAHASDVLAAPKPNIVVILVDDLGYADLGFMGATDFDTPNIDALAKGGMTFE